MNFKRNSIAKHTRFVLAIGIILSVCLLTNQGSLATNDILKPGYASSEFRTVLVSPLLSSDEDYTLSDAQKLELYIKKRKMLYATRYFLSLKSLMLNIKMSL